MSKAQAIYLKDKIYIRGGAGETLDTLRDAARLYVYCLSTDLWDGEPLDTPVYNFALTTYDLLLVLVGGRDYVPDQGPGSCTNKLWTWGEHAGQWKETLSPMRTKRSFATAVNVKKYLIVAGGKGETGDKSNAVEVYDGNQWANAQCLPKADYLIQCVVYDSNLYLMGGYQQEKIVYYASLDSLIASCQPCETPQTSSVWKRLPDVPHEQCSPAVFGSRLVAVGGGMTTTSSEIHAYSPHAYPPHTQPWEHVGKMPVSMNSTCTVVLPTGELIVVGGMMVIENTFRYSDKVFKTTLKSKCALSTHNVHR